MSAITRIELVAGDAEFGVGTRWRETRTVFGKEATEEMEVIAVEAPSRYVVEAESAGTRYESALAFEPVGDDPDAPSTHVTMTFDAVAMSLRAKLLAPLGWLFRGATRKMVQRDLDDMKASLEAEAEAEAGG
jgi:hypothetical protein